MGVANACGCARACRAPFSITLDKLLSIIVLHSPHVPMLAQQPENGGAQSLPSLASCLCSTLYPKKYTACRPQSLRISASALVPLRAHPRPAPQSTMRSLKGENVGGVFPPFSLCSHCQSLCVLVEDVNPPWQTCWQSPSDAFVWAPDEVSVF